MPRNQALNPYPPEIEWSRTCRKCNHTLYRTITGNVVDYRHQGAETQCPKPQPLSLDQLFAKLVGAAVQTPSQQDYALDA